MVENEPAAAERILYLSFLFLVWIQTEFVRFFQNITFFLITLYQNLLEYSRVPRFQIFSFASHQPTNDLIPLLVSLVCLLVLEPVLILVFFLFYIYAFAYCCNGFPVSDMERKFLRCGERIPQVWRRNSLDVEREFLRCGKEIPQLW